jgi:hypothetical protein
LQQKLTKEKNYQRIPSTIPMPPRALRSPLL